MGFPIMNTTDIMKGRERTYASFEKPLTLTLYRY